MNLKIEIIQKGVPQVRVAKKLGIHPSRLSGIVNGWARPTEEQMQKIAEYLGRTVEEVFSDDSSA